MEDNVLVFFCFLLHVANLLCYLLQIVLVVLVLDLEVCEEVRPCGRRDRAGCTHSAVAAQPLESVPSEPKIGSSRSHVKSQFS